MNYFDRLAIYGNVSHGAGYNELCRVIVHSTIIALREGHEYSEHRKAILTGGQDLYWHVLEMSCQLAKLKKMLKKCATYKQWQEEMKKNNAEV